MIYSCQFNRNVFVGVVYLHIFLTYTLFNLDQELASPCRELFPDNDRRSIHYPLHILVYIVIVYISISAVKRLKYLIEINQCHSFINVIVNSRLIAMNRTILSILNVP